MYLFVVMSIGAVMIGLWNRFVGRPSDRAETFDLRKAA
jgi:hypothetical protein